MSIKLLCTTARQTIISDLKEWRNQKTNELDSYLVRDPLVIVLDEQPVFLDEAADGLEEDGGVSISFIRWLKFSKQNEAIVTKESVAWITDPVEELEAMYLEATQAGAHTYDEVDTNDSDNLIQE